MTAHLQDYLMAVSFNALRVDETGTVIGTHSGRPHQVYSPFGFIDNNHLATRLGFNGQPYERISNCYPLGQGKRFYAPNHNTFNQADSKSPFGEGGINAYAYCHNDPINRYDPSGHVVEWLRRSVLKWTGLSPTPQLRVAQAATPTLQRQVPRADHSILNINNGIAVLQQEEIISIPTAESAVRFLRTARRWMPEWNVHQLTYAPVKAAIEMAKYVRGAGPCSSPGISRSRPCDP
ncbi:RHS repeat-associated core domain-containing protein [Pseudomonas putida]|uniref:RHS repeat-associated core domain-containing protein n=1 Tax=Pseudomonas putida TaxID=303 RepID=UPI003D313031